MSILLSAIGFLIFLFVFWKRLKEDYLPNQIFSTYFYMLFFALLSFLLSRRFIFNWWFWITFLGFLLGLMLGVLKFKLKIYESFEATVLGMIILFSLFFLGDSVANLSMVSFFGFVTGILVVGFFQYIDMHYKNYSWYKSGKVGFSGLISVSVLFLIRSIVFSIYPYVLSFTPKYDFYLSACSSFIFFMLTYNLSRSKL